MAKAKTTKPRTRRAQQPYLAEEMAPKKNPVIHPLALDYVTERDDRIEVGKREKAAKTKLIEAMLREGLREYQFPGVVHVILNEQTGVKVITDKPDSNGEVAEDEE